MADPQQEEWADVASTDESDMSASSGSSVLSMFRDCESPNLQVSQVSGTPSLQNLDESSWPICQPQNAVVSDTVILDLPELSDLQLEHSRSDDVDLVPPPPPPPPPRRALLHASAANRMAASPPPPPPLPLSLPSSSFGASTSRQVRAALYASMRQLEEVHFTLMDAIRSTGGAEHAQLRSIRHPHANDRTQEASNTISTFDDLIQELRMKLNLRRHSFSGLGGSRRIGCGSDIFNEYDGGVGCSGGAATNCNVKRAKSCTEAKSSLCIHFNPIFSHLSLVMPQSSASALQLKQADTGSENTSDNENEEDWFD